MSIRNFCDVPDDRVPAWVRERREAGRAALRADNRKLCSCMLHFASRGEVLKHCDETGHRPLVVEALDSCIVRPGGSNET